MFDVFGNGVRACPLHDLRIGKAHAKRRCLRTILKYFSKFSFCPPDQNGDRQQIMGLELKQYIPPPRTLEPGSELELMLVLFSPAPDF